MGRGRWRRGRKQQRQAGAAGRDPETWGVTGVAGGWGDRGVTDARRTATAMGQCGDGGGTVAGGTGTWMGPCRDTRGQGCHRVWGHGWDHTGTHGDRGGTTSGHIGTGTSPCPDKWGQGGHHSKGTMQGHMGMDPSLWGQGCHHDRTQGTEMGPRRDRDVSWRVPRASPGVNHRAPDVKAWREGRKEGNPPPPGSGAGFGGVPLVPPPTSPGWVEGTPDWAGPPKLGKGPLQIEQCTPKPGRDPPPPLVRYSPNWERTPRTGQGPPAPGKGPPPPPPRSLGAGAPWRPPAGLQAAGAAPLLTAGPAHRLIGRWVGQ